MLGVAARRLPRLLRLRRRARRRDVRRRDAASCSCAARASAPRRVALAGSTRRSADPAVDDHLGEALLRSDKDREEQAIVARRIARALRPHAVWVTAAPEPVVVRIANIQHLATPIRAQLSRPLRSDGAGGGCCIPTPAVGGEPFAAAEPLIPELEGFDRGWYAGPVGWTDANGDGELCVALRCALLRGAVAHCYAGRRRRARLRSGSRAGRDRGQAAGAAAGAGGLSTACRPVAAPDRRL